MLFPNEPFIKQIKFLKFQIHRKQRNILPKQRPIISKHEKTLSDRKQYQDQQRVHRAKYAPEIDPVGWWITVFYRTVFQILLISYGAGFYLFILSFKRVLVKLQKGRCTKTVITLIDALLNSFNNSVFSVWNFGMLTHPISHTFMTEGSSSSSSYFRLIFRSKLFDLKNAFNSLDLRLRL